jgi:hypothetical protein
MPSGADGRVKVTTASRLSAPLRGQVDCRNRASRGGGSLRTAMGQLHARLRSAAMPEIDLSEFRRQDRNMLWAHIAQELGHSGSERVQHQLVVREQFSSRIAPVQATTP